MALPAESVPYYSQIVRDYPLSDLVKDSKKHLVELKATVPEPNPIALQRGRQKTEAEGKGVLGWMTFGLVKGGSSISTDTGAASVKGGQLSIDPGKEQ